MSEYTCIILPVVIRPKNDYFYKTLNVIVMKNILVPVDFSDLSLHVMEYAGDLAKAIEGKVWLIHVAAPNPEFVGYEPGPLQVREVRAQELRREHADLQAMSSHLKNRGIDTTPLLIQGPTVQTILDEAHRVKADLIVMGARNHNIFYRAFLGSISEGVMRKTCCPALIVPEKGEND